MSYLARLLAFKENVTTLGIYDSKLWKILSIVSLVLRSAIHSR